jgi:DNA helicase-2/ATP-dependent DNA helicase PcrA
VEKGGVMAWGIGLHEKQVRAAEFLGTHARLLAGPGTGKTVTLISRIIKLITEDGIAPESIVTLVFTRVNAFDLRRTLTSELDEFGKGIPHISTLHSYALRQLLRNSILITVLPQPLRIADDLEEKYIIRPDLGRSLDINDKEVKAKFADLSSDWQSLAVEDPNFKPADPQFLGAWRDHRTLYGYTLRSELIWQLKHAMEENPDTFQIEGEIKHILVDEYQDLNKCLLVISKVVWPIIVCKCMTFRPDFKLNVANVRRNTWGVT